MKDQCFGSLEEGGSILESLHTTRGERAHAIAAGELVDVSSPAMIASFRVPVAVTSAAWRACVQYDAADSAIEERLWTVLFSAFGAIRRKERRTDRVVFSVNVEHDGRQVAVELLAVVEPGDRVEPVITIYLGSEN